MRPSAFDSSRAAAARGLGAPVGKVDDHALCMPLDRRMRLLDEACQPLREPVIAARLLAPAIHSLLNDGPPALVGDDEAVQIKVKAVLDRSTVDLGYKPARGRKGGAVESNPLADGKEFVRRLPRVFAAPAADMESELMAQRRKPAFERSDHARGNAGGMPIHSHHRAERLEPEWVGQAAQQLIAPVVMNDGLADHRAETGHALREPFRHGSAVQRQIGASSPSSLHHSSQLILVPSRFASLASLDAVLDIQRGP